MSLPSRDELNEMVDMDFREQHPHAPEKLDPNDPAQADLVHAWVAIRDHKVTAWTDDVFATFFPDAGRLDPGDPRDAQLIEFWRDIHDQIRDGGPGKHDWSSFQPTTAAAFRTSPDGEPDPTIPDAAHAVDRLRWDAETLYEILADTELAEKAATHIEAQISEFVRVNGEGTIAMEGQWTSEKLDATAANPDAPDDPYFVRGLAIHAVVDATTFTISAVIQGQASGPNGTIGT